jgi:hypothetical protein
MKILAIRLRLRKDKRKISKLYNTNFLVVENIQRLWGMVMMKGFDCASDEAKLAVNLGNKARNSLNKICSSINCILTLTLNIVLYNDYET